MDWTWTPKYGRKQWEKAAKFLCHELSFSLSLSECINTVGKLNFSKWICSPRAIQTENIPENVRKEERKEANMRKKNEPKITVCPAWHTRYGQYEQSIEHLMESRELFALFFYFSIALLCLLPLFFHSTCLLRSHSICFWVCMSVLVLLFFRFAFNFCWFNFTCVFVLQLSFWGYWNRNIQTQPKIEREL